MSRQLSKLPSTVSKKALYFGLFVAFIWRMLARTTPPPGPLLLPPLSANIIRPTLNWSLRPPMAVLSAARTFSNFLPPPIASVDDQFALVSRMMSTFGRSEETPGLIEKMSMSSAGEYTGRPARPAERTAVATSLRGRSGIMAYPCFWLTHSLSSHTRHQPVGAP